MSKINTLAKLQKMKAIRQRQVFCPVSKLRAITSPLTVQSDLQLKTMVSSPDLYDRELAILIYDHTEFPDVPNVKPTFEEFIEHTSDFDKKSLLWGIYDSTYQTLGKHAITCPKCKAKLEEIILAKDLVQPDTFAGVWDKDVSFENYTYPVDIEIGDVDISKFVFNISIPSISKHLDVLKLISTDDMKSNFNKFNSIVSKPEELALITKSIDIYGEAVEPAEVDPGASPLANQPQLPDDSITNVYEIHTIIKDFITLDVINTVIDAFEEQFSKYNPSFKKSITCKTCKNTFDFSIDIEVALFRSFLRL
jgi:hypothetical protein